MPSRKKGKRQSEAVVRKATKRGRLTDVEPDSTNDVNMAQASVTSTARSSSLFSASFSAASSQPSLSLPSLSASSLSSSGSSSCHSPPWHTLPLELLLLIADCVPSYRLLLPLSSTSRRFYELIHEESASGVVQTATAVHDVSSHFSCWRHHPPVRVAIGRSSIQVDSQRYLLEGRDVSFVSHVLTSLRALPSLELNYDCAGGPHAANLYPLRHFTHLRSLTLLLGDEELVRQHNLAANLSTALLSLPSLVSLSVRMHNPPFTNSLMLQPTTLQRLVSERLLHLTLNHAQYQQLTTSDHTFGRRARNNSKQPPLYPRVLSVASTGNDASTLTLIRQLFPNVQHVALSDNVELDVVRTIQHCDDETVSLDSLFVYIQQLRRTQQAADSGMRYRLRCLVLHWDIIIDTELREVIGDMLALVPNLSQLAISGGASVFQRSIVDLESLPSVFANVQLSELHYLQFTGGLLTGDIEHLFSPTEPPIFAAQLTHLSLSVRRSDRRMAAARLSLLPILCPSLQHCHIELQVPNTALDNVVWQTAIRALRLQLGSVWSNSWDEVRMARSDVVWRQSVGLVDLPLLGKTSAY